MKVEFFECEICGDTFSACEKYEECSNCAEILCSNCHEEQVLLYGKPLEGSEKASYYGENAADKCDLCSELIVHDDDIIEYLLEILGLTKERAIQNIKDLRGIE